MNYSLMDFPRLHKKNIVYYKVRITSFDFAHTHPLTAVFYKRSVFLSKSPDKFNLKDFTHALELLKVDPKLSSNVLRKLLYNVMPNGVLLGKDFLRNFKLCAAIYHSKDTN